MRVVDANVLLYAINSSTPQHDASHRWLEHALAGGDTVGFSWVALLAFVRLSTKANIFESPLTASEALEQVEAWTTASNARVLHPGERHSSLLAGLLEPLGSAGNLVNDAHLAATALEHRASMVTYDNDFSRFRGVSWHRPDALLPS